MPVLASEVGTFGAQVRDGVDGLLVPPGDEASLVTALKQLVDPDELARLRAGVRPPDLTSPWATYVGILEALASPSTAAADELPEEERTLPTTVTDRVLAPVRRALASKLGLPRGGDAVAAWAALGALAAVVRLGDDGHHSAVILDESGSRSPLARWARAIGFAPVELGLTGPRSSVAVLDVDTASLDVITRLHPSGCDADDADEALSQASWALRSGGLLCLTLPLGPATAEGAVGPAEVRGVLARAP